MRVARVLTRVPRWSRQKSNEPKEIKGLCDDLNEPKEIKGLCDDFYENPSNVRDILERLSPAAQEEIEKAWDERSHDKKAVPPGRDQVIRLALLAAIPMVGFGFMDNAVMIVAGDYIDARLCVTCGFSTLFAAGLGNIISDVAGVAAAGPIEVVARRIGIRGHGLTPAQMRRPAVITMKYVGTAFGVSIGCVLGMFPLLWPAEYRLWAPRAELEKETAT